MYVVSITYIRHKTHVIPADRVSLNSHRFSFSITNLWSDRNLLGNRSIVLPAIKNLFPIGIQKGNGNNRRYNWSCIVVRNNAEIKRNMNANKTPIKSISN